MKSRRQEQPSGRYKETKQNCHHDPPAHTRFFFQMLTALPMVIEQHFRRRF
jgi:hypothetical protein